MEIYRYVGQAKTLLHILIQHLRQRLYRCFISVLMTAFIQRQSR